MAFCFLFIAFGQLEGTWPHGGLDILRVCGSKDKIAQLQSPSEKLGDGNGMSISVVIVSCFNC